MNSYRVLIVVPYFGKFPQWFQLWLDSCGRNKDYEWQIFTDDKGEYNFPDNVHVRYIELNELKELFEQKLGFEIFLGKPYKLCDYRPLYGFLFSEYLTGYTHWGYCDVDMIFGRISHFITDSMLNEYSKINTLGHFSIIKNAEPENNLFRKCDYKSILQSPCNLTFDEVFYKPNINMLLKQENMKLCEYIPYGDINNYHYNFYLTRYTGVHRTKTQRYVPTIFALKNGNLMILSINKQQPVCEELVYVHFQKRAIDASRYTGKDYLLVPNAIIPYQEPTVEIIEKYSKDNLRYYMSNVKKYIQRKLFR